MRIEIEERREREREINWDSHALDPDFYNELTPGISVRIILDDGFSIYVNEESLDQFGGNPDPIAEDRWGRLKCVILLRDEVLNPYASERDQFDSRSDSTLGDLAGLRKRVEVNGDFEGWDDLSRWPLRPVGESNGSQDFAQALERLFDPFDVLRRWPG